MEFRWRADDGPTLNADLVAVCFFQGIRTSIATEPYSIVIFQEGRSGPLPRPPLDPHMQARGGQKTHTLIKLLI